MAVETKPLHGIKRVPQCNYIGSTVYHFIAEHCVGRYKFVWALLRKYPGIFSGLFVQHFVKRRPFKQSANQVQNTEV